MSSKWALQQRQREIVKQESKEIFSEALQAFAAGSYRSAIVVSWTTAVYDILLKLDELAADSVVAARETLEAFEKNKTSLGVEKWLVNEVCQRTDILFEPDRDALLRVQEIRHTAAHPVVGPSGLELGTITREAAAYSIQVVLDHLLCRPALHGNRVFRLITDTIDALPPTLQDSETFKSYIRLHFLRRSTPTAVCYVLQHMWRLTFINPEPWERVQYQFYVLDVILEHYTDDAIAYISDQKHKFVGCVDDYIEWMVLYCARYPELYNAFTDAMKVVLNKGVEENGLAIVSWFMHDTFDEFVDQISDKVELPTRWMPVAYQTFKTHNQREVLQRLAVLRYSESATFNEADLLFQQLIAPYYKEWPKHLFQFFVEETSKNDQTYRRGLAAENHKEIADFYSHHFQGNLDVEQIPALAAKRLGLDD